MGVSRSLVFVFISALLLLSFTHGAGKKLVQTVEQEEESRILLEENTGISPQDYEDPGPNTNPRSGFLPPSSPGSTPHN